jgi:hypothetical protein
MPNVNLPKFELDFREAFSRKILPENLDTALALICERVEPLDVSEAARKLEQQCHCPPGYHRLKMVALDDLLGTFGVEHLGEVDTRLGPTLEYLNVGDCYTLTLTWSRGTGQYRIECYADAIERLERQGVRL